MILNSRIFSARRFYILLILVLFLFTSFKQPSVIQDSHLDAYLNNKITTLEGKKSKISQFKQGTFIFKNDCACFNCFDSLAIILKENYLDLPPVYLIINTKDKRHIVKRKEAKILALKTGANENNVFFNKIGCRKRNGKLIEERTTPFVIIKKDSQYIWHSTSDLSTLKRIN